MSTETVPGLFVYGSLTFAEVLGLVLGRVPAHRPARAVGWRAAALRDRPFPGLVAAGEPGSDRPGPGGAQAVGAVTGLLLTDLTERERAAADAFEGPMYTLAPIGLDDGTPAVTYACTDRSLVLPYDWDALRFRGELPSYLERCRDWLAARGG